jgi:hypothetical protein
MDQSDAPKRLRELRAMSAAMVEHSRRVRGQAGIPPQESAHCRETAKTARQLAALSHEYAVAARKRQDAR